MFIFFNPILNHKDEYEQQQYSSDLLKSYICVCAHANLADRKNFRCPLNLNRVGANLSLASKFCQKVRWGDRYVSIVKRQKSGSVAQLVRAGDS